MFQVISSDFHVFSAWSLNSLPSTAQTQWQYIQLTPLTQRDSPPVLRGFSLSPPEKFKFGGGGGILCDFDIFPTKLCITDVC